MSDELASTSLLEHISESGFRSSVFTTYSCYFPFYEEVVLHGPAGQLVRHTKLAGRHQVARWLGEPRPLPYRKPAVRTPPSSDPLALEQAGYVEVRPLSHYEALAEVVG